MESIKLLERFLEKKYPRISAQLSEGDKVFLARYSIDRQQSHAVALLKELGIGESFDRYFRENEYARIIREDIQSIYQRFQVKLCGKVANPFENSFPVFLDWWLSEMDDNGRCHCCYCGIDDDTLQAAFSAGIVHSKKTSFSGNLQIERLDSEGGYTRNNCRFACAICNNAKSDMISPEAFEQYFAPGIRQYWQHIRRELGQDGSR